MNAWTPWTHFLLVSRVRVKNKTKHHELTVKKTCNTCYWSWKKTLEHMLGADGLIVISFVWCLIDADLLPSSSSPSMKSSPQSSSVPVPVSPCLKTELDKNTNTGHVEIQDLDTVTLGSVVADWIPFVCKEFFCCYCRTVNEAVYLMLQYRYNNPMSNFSTSCFPNMHLK